MKSRVRIKNEKKDKCRRRHERRSGGCAHNLCHVEDLPYLRERGRHIDITRPLRKGPWMLPLAFSDIHAGLRMSHPRLLGHSDGLWLLPPARLGHYTPTSGRALDVTSCKCGVGLVTCAMLKTCRISESVGGTYLPHNTCLINLNTQNLI